MQNAITSLALQDVVRNLKKGLFHLEQSQLEFSTLIFKHSKVSTIQIGAGIKTRMNCRLSIFAPSGELPSVSS